jgi:transcriptional regulator with XRE-family HTH domain
MANGLKVGDLLRDWRQQRRLSQLDLAVNADISSRHLSFIETGRTKPSRDMILLLAEELQVPLRQRNVLLTAGGYAQIYPERNFDDPALATAGKIVEIVLSRHEPNPALALDNHWQLLAANRAVPPLLKGVDPSLLESPVNVIRLSLHPDGLAPRIRNLAEWRNHAIARLKQRIDVTADRKLVELLEEILRYPAPMHSERERSGPTPIAVPFQLATEVGPIGFITTTMVFGTALDVTLSEMMIECLFPQNDESAALLKKLLKTV